MHQRKMPLLPGGARYQRGQAILREVAESTKDKMPLCRRQRVRKSERRFGKRGEAYDSKNTALQKKNPMYGRDQYLREEEYCNYRSVT